MTNITDEFKKLMKKERISSDFLIPLTVWCSGSRSNIEAVQKINKKIPHGKHNIYILELIYNINISHFLKYPKILKIADADKQYYRDFATYFGWSQKEMYKNINVIDLESSKEEIANLFGYDDKERKNIGLKNNGKNTKSRRGN